MVLAALLLCLLFFAFAARLALHQIRDKDRAYWWKDERPWVIAESAFCAAGVALSAAGGIARIESSEPSVLGLTVSDRYVGLALAALAGVRFTFIRAIRDRCMQARRHTARRLVAPVVDSLDTPERRADFLRRFAARYSDDIPGGVGALNKATTGKDSEELVMFLSLPTTWRYGHAAKDGRSIGMLSSVLELHNEIHPASSPGSPYLPPHHEGPSGVS